MADSIMSNEEQWNDLWNAQDAVLEIFERWAQDRILSLDQCENVREILSNRRKKWHGVSHNAKVPAIGLPTGYRSESPVVKRLRHLVFTEATLDQLVQTQAISLAQSHLLKKEIEQARATLRRKLVPGDQTEHIQKPPADDQVDDADDVVSLNPMKSQTSGETEHSTRPRRSILQILLDPRSIQMLLAFGGSLMVLGIVILLWINEYFTPPVVAIGLASINGTILVLGLWLRRSTRFQTPGLALSLIACLIMPLNLWYYHVNDMITLDGHLWVAALIVSILYAVSAIVLRDSIFVYVFCAGVTLTAMLFLADLPPSPQKFWEIAAPATALVILGLIAIHLERAFIEHDGVFSRKNFGMAFFFSGHFLLASGLILVLGAQVAGDWFYDPVFASIYRQFGAQPSPIIGELRWLALVLILAGTYAYVYSDLVVRHIGLYVHIAAGTLMWALLLIMQMLNIELGVGVLIGILALISIAVNSAQAWILQDRQSTRSLPILGLLLPFLATSIGLVVYVRAISTDLRSVWSAEPPNWSYVISMFLTAVACRLGAHLYRDTRDELSKLYFLGSAFATLIAATSLLSACGLTSWPDHAPWIMIIPIGYVIAARFYRGRHEESSLVLIGHVSTIVMILSSLSSAIQGFAPVEQNSINLVLALFSAEAAVFYILAAVLHRQFPAIHLAALMICGSVWQIVTYFGMAAEYYTVIFAVIGLAMLIVYRLGVFESIAGPKMVNALFHGANVLLSLSFVAALFIGLSRLAIEAFQWETVALSALLAAIAAAAVFIVHHMSWRRWYVIMAVGQVGLCFLGITVLSELTMFQKLELFSVVAGTILLAVGHAGWYREQESQNDMVSLALILGSILLGAPLALATIIDRSQNHFILLNEMGFLFAAMILVTSGFMCQIKSTTLAGTSLTVLYFVTLLIFVPWGRLNSVALMITIGGGTLFATGLGLSFYRERLLTLPDRIKNREGIFKILNWR